MNTKRYDAVIDFTSMSNCHCFRLKTGRAKQWWRRHVEVEDWQDINEGVVVNQSFVEEIAHHMVDDGLRLGFRWDGSTVRLVQEGTLGEED